MKERVAVIVVSAAATLMLGAPTASAQTTVNISVEGTATGTPLERIWAYHGYDEINYTTLPDGLNLLETLGSFDPSPPYVRTHFYLNSGTGAPSMKWGSTNVYSLDSTGAPVYSWTLLNGITDALTQSKTLPFVEIGFMPHDLSTHPDPYMNSMVTTLDGGCFYPPTDYVKWENLISTLGTHEGARYANAATSWLWELWNEPELNYWHGTPAEYDKLFDYTEAGLHKALPTATLGGPASANVTSGFMRQFLQHCATGANAVSGKNGARLDLVTFHAKGGTAVVGNSVEMDMGHQLTLHSTGFKTIASFPQFKKTPIVISEGDPDGCAACVTNADNYRRVPAYGAYEVEMMRRSLDLEGELGVNLRGIIAWAFMFPNQALFADYRVLSTNDIPLAVLNAFKLLGTLDGVRVPVTSSGALTADAIVASSVRGQPDIDAMATLHGQQIQVLVWNYHDDIVTAAASPIHLVVNVPATFGAQATVTHLRVDDTHGNAYGTWVSQGSPATPSAAQLTQLQQAASALTLQAPQTVAVAANAVAIDFSLPRFGISLLTLSPSGNVEAPDASVGPAPGVDASVGNSPGGPAIDSGGTDSVEGVPVAASDDAQAFDDDRASPPVTMKEDDAAPSPEPQSGATDDAGQDDAKTSPGGKSGCSCYAVGPSGTLPEGAAWAVGAMPLALVAMRRQTRRGLPTKAK